MTAEIIVNNRPRRVKDYTGRRFGILTVIEQAGFDAQPCGLTHTIWKCRCDCGNEIKIRRAYLAVRESCGCVQSSKLKLKIQRMTKHGTWQSGQSSKKKRAMYFTWRGIKARCTNPNATGYKNYGGRGISYDPKWDSFSCFFSDMESSHFDGSSIDRIDNNGNYCKENCRWADSKTQCNNARYNIILTHNGISMSIYLWSDRLGISRIALYARKKLGWTDHEILTKPIRVTRRSW